MKRTIRAMSEVQQMCYQDVFSEIKKAVLKHDERRLRELSRSSFYDRAMSEIRKRMGVVASTDIFADSFHKIDGYMFKRSMYNELRKMLTRRDTRISDESDHYGYFLALEGIQSMAELVKIVTRCVNRMSYDAFLEGEVDESQFLIAAVDEPAWVELTLSYYGSDRDCYIAIDADKGNVLTEDWYEEDYDT